MSQRASSPASAVFERPVWQTYGFAAAMLLLALLVRWLIDPLTKDAVPLAMMYVGVALTAWFGGWKPAALTAIAGYYAGIALFVTPRNTLKIAETDGAPRLVFYFVSCAITIYLFEFLRRGRQRHAASEARFVSILENMHEGFFSISPD